MRDDKLKKELDEANQALERGMLTRLGYTFLIEQLIEKHPNPKATFIETIKKYPCFEQEITNLADLLEVDLGSN